MTSAHFKLIEDKLLAIVEELEKQPEVASFYPEGTLPYPSEMARLREYISYAGEYGLAYELIVSCLETMPFKLSGASAVKLLEVGLLMGFKTEQEKDKLFDRRRK
jgi:hypothetical protein